MTYLDLVIWLRERTALSILSDKILQAIAPRLEARVVNAQECLVIEDTSVEYLYISGEPISTIN